MYWPTKQVKRPVRKYMESAVKGNIANLPQVRKAVDVLEVEDHPLLDLIYNVNPWMNRFELFDLTDEFQELTGNSYWYLLKNRAGVPKQIWMLSPDRTKIVPSREEWIMGYKYTTVEGIDIPFDKDEIIHFKFINPRNSFYGFSPLSAMADTYNIQLQMDEYQYNLVKNQAIPPVAIIAPKDSVVTENQYRRLMARWNATYQGAKNSGKTAYLEMGFDIKQLAQTPKEMTFLLGRKWTMQELCAAYGVPLSKVTTEAVGRANAEAGDFQYMADTIRPRCTLVEEQLNKTLVPMMDPNLFFMFDNCVPDDKEYQLKERMGNLQSNVTVVNEEREQLGKDAVEWGDRPIVSTGVGPMQTQEEKQADQDRQAEQQAQQLQDAQDAKDTKDQEKKDAQAADKADKPDKGEKDRDIAKALADVIYMELEKKRRAFTS